MVAFVAGCGATATGGARPITNPLEERTAVPPRPPAAPQDGGAIVAPGPAVPPGAIDAERASAVALEYFAEVLGVSPRELRAEVVEGENPSRVLVRDAFGNAHTAEVSAGGTAWVGETRESGVLVAFDERQRLVVIQARGRALTLRLSKAGTGPTLAMAPGTVVGFAYDSSARGDGVPVLAQIAALP